MGEILDRLELVGFDSDVIVASSAIYELTSRELRLYEFLILCYRGEDKFPSLFELTKCLNIEDEGWSEATIRRTMAGLVKKGYASRTRRMKQPSVTTLFKVPRRVTGDTTVGSQVIRQDNNIQDENGHPTIARIFTDTLHPNLSAFDMDFLKELEDVYGYESVVNAIKEASTSKGADKKLIGVKYLRAICANSGKPKKSGVPANYAENWHE